MREEYKVGGGIQQRQDRADAHHSAGRNRRRPSALVRDRRHLLCAVSSVLVRAPL
jgi:hypothetical protein